MAGKRPKPEEIVSKLRQVEVLQGQGMSIGDAVRQIGVTRTKPLARQGRVLLAARAELTRAHLGMGAPV